MCGDTRTAAVATVPGADTTRQTGGHRSNRVDSPGENEHPPLDASYSSRNNPFYPHICYFSTKKSDFSCRENTCSPWIRHSTSGENINSTRHSTFYSWNRCNAPGNKHNSSCETMFPPGDNCFPVKSSPCSSSDFNSMTRISDFPPYVHVNF